MKKFRIVTIFIVIITLFSTNVRAIEKDELFNPSLFTTQIINKDDFTVAPLNMNNEKVALANTRAAGNPISLNSMYQVQLQSGYGILLSFTAPNKGFYTIETYSSVVDTVLYIEGGLDGSPYSDDDNGLGTNAKLRFHLRRGENITIALVAPYTGPTGVVPFQIRQHRVSTFGYDYGSGDINTSGEYSDVINALPNHRANVYDHNNTNSTGNTLFDTDETGWSRINSEVFFFTGHGLLWVDGNGNEVGYGGEVSLPNGSFNVNNLQNGDTFHTDIAFWAVCYGGNANNHFGESMAQASVRAGARTSFGWNDSVYVGSATTFQRVFFEEAAKTNVTFARAAERASFAMLWPFDNCKDYVIEGDRDFQIYNTRPSVDLLSKSNETNNKVTSKQFKQDMETFEYAEYPLSNTKKRVYKTINGLLTNDFYDVEIDCNGNEISYEKSSANITLDKLNKTTFTSYAKNKATIPNKIVNNNVLFDKIIKTTTHNVYYLLDGELIPIEINFIDYSSSNTGAVVQEVICTNLNNGNLISYDDINSIF